jgi:hypothetical protein
LNKLKVVEESSIAILLGLRIAPVCNGGFSRKPDNPQENRQLPLPANTRSECEFGGVSYLARKKSSNSDIPYTGFSLTPGRESGILETLRGVAPGVCV